MLKKIDNIENRISKTLVDTFIDLQLEDAPLILRKGMQGADKCGSCNQNVPDKFNNTIINPFSDINTSHDGKFKKKTDKTINTSVTIQLPDIKTNGLHMTEMVNKDRLKIKDNIKPMQQSKSMRHFDEQSERQLNNVISVELEKLVVNPENLMKASKRIYDNIEKKSKMNNDK